MSNIEEESEEMVSFEGEGERAGASGSSDERGEGVCCSVLLRERVVVLVACAAALCAAGAGCVIGFGAPWSFQRCYSV